jgi:hypothetical protein
MALFPRTPCLLREPQGRDLFGQTTLGPARPAVCAVVKFEIGADKTSVRTDSSATRGNAEEITAAARLLFPPLFRPSLGTVVELHGNRVEIKSVHPRLTVTGQLDHYQVDCEIAEDL